MKNTELRAWTVFITLGLAALFPPQRVTGQGSAGAEVLTNESVVQMVVGKVPKDLILTKIQSTRAAFDITANGLVSLFQRKVSTDTIKAMMQASAGDPNSKELLENSAIVYMVTNGLPRDIIVAKIQLGKPGFDLTSNGLISLNQNKVPQPVVKAMMASAAATPSTSAASPKPPSSAQSPAPTSPAPAAVSPPSNAGQTPPTAARGSAGGTGSQDKKSTAAKKKK
jgi:hypothetical protein